MNPQRLTCPRLPRPIYFLLLYLLLLGLGGAGFWLIEPRVHSFGQGVWLAFTTAATVGYGDIVPSTAVSRAFAGLVVLLGLAVLPVIGAGLATLTIKKQEREIEQELVQLINELRREVQALRNELAAK